MASTNTGYKAYSKLVKVTDDGTNRPLDANNELASVSGRPQSVKNNINTDPNYVSAVEDLVLCPVGIGQLYTSMQLAFYPNADVCDKTKSEYQVHNQVFNQYSNIYNADNSAAVIGWYSNGTNKAYWNGLELSQYQECSAPPSNPTPTNPTPTAVTESYKAYSYPDDAANGQGDQGIVEYYNELGNPEYEYLPGNNYNQGILTEGPCVSITHFGIISLTNASSCNITPTPNPSPVTTSPTTESRFSLGGNPPEIFEGQDQEGFEEPGYVTYYTNSERTAQVEKTFVGTRYHLGITTPAPCVSFTHYGIISEVNVGSC